MTSYDAIIVGAGAAGLAAAETLAARERNVLVVEARDRIGGRVRCAYLPHSVETVELGAEFIHGPAPETRALLRATDGVAVSDDDGTSWRLNEHGVLEEDVDDFWIDPELLRGCDAIPADESLAEFLARFEDDPRRAGAAHRAKVFAEGFDAVDPSRASVRGIAAEWRSGVDSQAARPSSGYAPLIDELCARARRAGASLRLDSPVHAVSWNERGADVKIGASTERARAVIVTLPVGVLRASSVAFDPQLPPFTVSAIDHLEMGDAVRVVMLFRNAFWETIHDGRYRDAGFFRPRNGRFGAFWTQYPQRSRTIVAWAGGPRASAIGRDEFHEIGRVAARAFGELFGDARRALDELESSFVHDWRHDPFALGAYSYVLVGGERAREDLARPVGDVLFFAGEATANAGQGGTVNGAIVSGVRAARAVDAALSKETT